MPTFGFNIAENGQAGISQIDGKPVERPETGQGVVCEGAEIITPGQVLQDKINNMMTVDKGNESDNVNDHEGLKTPEGTSALPCGPGNLTS